MCTYVYYICIMYLSYYSPIPFKIRMSQHPEPLKVNKRKLNSKNVMQRAYGIEESKRVVHRDSASDSSSGIKLVHGSVGIYMYIYIYIYTYRYQHI
jgi:hypothetical protein